MAVTEDSLSIFIIEEQAERLRRVAVSAAKASVRAIHAGNLQRLLAEDDESDDDSEESMLAYDPRHPGALPNRSDARAKEVAWERWLEGFDNLNIPTKLMVPAGEEAGTATREVRRGDFLIRQDSLDGTTNAGCLLNDFASVQLVDYVRSVHPNNSRARHMAGAITNSAGITISWIQASTYVKSRACYLSIRGRVYIEGDPWGVGEREIRGRRWDRKPGTVAAVATSPQRMEALRGVLDRLDMSPTVVYTLGGTPLAPALIGGDIECLIEPNAVSLHDSALLMPHQILGGKVTDLELGDLDFLSIYERSALQLDPNEKPIGGYMAWGDAAAVGRAEAVS